MSGLTGTQSPPVADYGSGYGPPPPGYSPAWPAQNLGAWPPSRQPAPSSRAGLAALAQVFLWGGFLLVLYLFTKNSFFSFELQQSSSALRSLDDQAIRRFIVIGLLSLPFVVAVLVAGVDAQSRMLGLGGAAAFGVVRYVTYATPDPSMWVVFMLADVILLAAWLAARGRPAVSYLALGPAAVIAGIWYRPANPGRYLRDVPFRHEWSSPFEYAMWGEAVYVPVAIVGLIGFLLANASGRPIAPTGRGRVLSGAVALSGLTIVTIFAIVVVTATYH